MTQSSAVAILLPDADNIVGVVMAASVARVPVVFVVLAPRTRTPISFFHRAATQKSG
eukprot:COSAG06_NODE_3578_length_5160_cov_13.296779_1_plen_56_part_10